MRERHFRLRSKDWVLFRQLRPDDAPELAEAVKQLSELSRYRRFHSALRELSDQMLGYLTDIDHHDHEALVALPFGSTRIVGIARFIRHPAARDTAEVALVVADAWQRRGLGTLLSRELARCAAEVGITAFTAEILTENTPTLELMSHLGPADLAYQGQTLSARMDSLAPQPDGCSAVSLLRAVSRANALLIPRLARAVLGMSTDRAHPLVRLSVPRYSPSHRPGPASEENSAERRHAAWDDER